METHGNSVCLECVLLCFGEALRCLPYSILESTHLGPKATSLSRRPENDCYAAMRHALGANLHGSIAALVFKRSWPA